MLPRTTRVFLRRTMAAITSRNIPSKYAADTQPFTVLIEGNIGSGKTTFLNYFRKLENDICLITEPVDKWRDLNGVNLLELMYTEPYRWAYPFQSYVTLTMLQSHTMVTDKKAKLMERSIYSAKNCFVENLHKNGVLHLGMYEMMKEWYKYIDYSTHIRADLIVYLRSSPEVVYDRMKKRARSEESCVPLKYLQELHELHEDWLIKHKRTPNIPVLVIDANLDLEHIGTEYKLSETKIMEHLEGQHQVPRRQSVEVSPAKRQCVS